MSHELQSSINKATNQFIRKIIEIIADASIQDLFYLSNVKTTTSPPKKKHVQIHPVCSVPGCGRNSFARGKGLCGIHWKAFKARQAKAETNKKRSQQSTIK